MTWVNALTSAKNCYTYDVRQTLGLCIVHVFWTHTHFSIWCVYNAEICMQVHVQTYNRKQNAILFARFCSFFSQLSRADDDDDGWNLSDELMEYGLIGLFARFRVYEHQMETKCVGVCEYDFSQRQPPQPSTNLALIHLMFDETSEHGTGKRAEEFTSNKEWHQNNWSFFSFFYARCKGEKIVEIAT